MINTEKAQCMLNNHRLMGDHGDLKQGQILFQAHVMCIVSDKVTDTLHLSGSYLVVSTVNLCTKARCLSVRALQRLCIHGCFLSSLHSMANSLLRYNMEITRSAAGRILIQPEYKP